MSILSCFSFLFYAIYTLLYLIKLLPLFASPKTIIGFYFALNRFSLSLSWQGPFWNGRSRRSRKWGTELAIKFERKLCPNGQFGQRQSFWTNIYSWSGALVYWLWEETRNPRVAGSIPALYTGWTFFHIFAVVIIIMFEQTKINEKEAGDGQFLYKKIIFDPIRT